MNTTDLLASFSDTDINSTANISGQCNTSATQIDIIKQLDTYRPMASAIDKYLTPLWYTIGFPGNLLAFIVWIQVRMRPSSGCYLAALALNDFIFLILHVCFELQNTWEIKTLYQPVWCEMFPILYISAQHLSPLLVLGFTVERYISICHPFQREHYCSTKRALIVIASLACLVLCLNAVQGYFWTFLESECSVRKLALENGTRSLWSVWSWVTELLIFGVVPIVILILNILVIKEAKRMSDRQKTIMMQQTTPGRSHKVTGQSATTFTLLVVSFYLIFSTLPVTVCYAVVNTFPGGNICLTKEELFTDPTWQSHFSYWSLRIVIQEIGMSHYVGNFYIYLFTGLAFRRELKILFLRIFCRGSSKRWFDNNGTEATQLTTYNHNYGVSNGRLDKSVNSLDTKP